MTRLQTPQPRLAVRIPAVPPTMTPITARFVNASNLRSLVRIAAGITVRAATGNTRASTWRTGANSGSPTQRDANGATNIVTASSTIAMAITIQNDEVRCLDSR